MQPFTVCDRRTALGSVLKTGALGLGGLLTSQTAPGMDSAAKAPSGQYSGIVFAAGVSDFTVDGCVVGAVGTFSYVSKNLQAWGIVVGDGPGDGYIITNNRSLANTAGGVHDGGSGKNKNVSGNLTVR